MGPILKRETNTFINRIRTNIDKRVDVAIAQTQNINAVLTSNQYGYRSLGLNQLGQYWTEDTGYTIGSGGVPVVS